MLTPDRIIQLDKFGRAEKPVGFAVELYPIFIQLQRLADLLMNKDTIVAALDKKPATAFSDEVLLYEVERMGKLPFGFDDVNTWLDSRKSSKHNAHLQKIMRQMGCDDNEGFIRTTHAATINDTFWIKSDSESLTWNQVSLYSNQFTETISRLAFEGVGLYVADFSSTSPELACEGSFRKCFRKEDRLGSFGSDIFIYKRGNEYGPGLEPYCEMLASEISAIISPDNYVPYHTVLLHDKLASKCNLFTNTLSGRCSDDTRTAPITKNTQADDVHTEIHLLYKLRSIQTIDCVIVFRYEHLSTSARPD